MLYLFFRWGAGGVCPGPGLVSLGAYGYNARVFVPALVGGMILNQLVTNGLNLNLGQDRKKI